MHFPEPGRELGGAHRLVPDSHILPSSHPISAGIPLGDVRGKYSFGRTNLSPFSLAIPVRWSCARRPYARFAGKRHCGLGSARPVLFVTPPRMPGEGTGSVIICHGGVAAELFESFSWHGAAASPGVRRDGTRAPRGGNKTPAPRRWPPSRLSDHHPRCSCTSCPAHGGLSGPRTIVYRGLSPHRPRRASETWTPRYHPGHGPTWDSFAAGVAGAADRYGMPTGPGAQNNRPSRCPLRCLDPPDHRPRPHTTRSFFSFLSLLCRGHLDIIPLSRQRMPIPHMPRRDNPGTLTAAGRGVCAWSPAGRHGVDHSLVGMAFHLARTERNPP